MKKQKNSEEKRVRKMALKETATFVKLIVIFEVLICVIILSVIRLDFFDIMIICIEFVCLNIISAVLLYFDFKNWIIKRCK